MTDNSDKTALRKLARQVWNGNHADRTISFMERTGLRPSRAHLLAGWPRTPGFDHTLTWRDPANNLVGTTEPYWWEFPNSAHDTLA